MLSRYCWFSFLSLGVVGTAASLARPRDGDSKNLCANLDFELDLQYYDFGRIHTCLCLSDIYDFITTNDVASTAAEAVGTRLVKNALHDHITYSQHHTAHCPKTSYRKRSPAELARDEHKCEPGLTKCGIYTGLPSSSDSHSSTSPSVDPYECIDTMTNLESCGGCLESYTLGLTPAEIAKQKQGVDCTTLQGVSDVQCRRGLCIVHKCKKGYELVPIAADTDGLFDCVRQGGYEAGGDLHNQVDGTMHWKE